MSVKPALKNKKTIQLDTFNMHYMLWYQAFKGIYPNKRKKNKNIFVLVLRNVYQNKFLFAFDHKKWWSLEQEIPVTNEFTNARKKVFAKTSGGQVRWQACVALAWWHGGTTMKIPHFWGVYNIVETKEMKLCWTLKLLWKSIKKKLFSTIALCMHMLCIVL